MDYKIPAGKNASNYHVYYISENGRSERYPTWVENGSIFFRTGHFSDYAIVYDENLKNETKESNSTKPVYRLYNAKIGEHFYTASEAEKDAIAKGGWNYEGVAFSVSGNKEVYRLLSGGKHFFTADKTECDNLVKIGWKLEGVAFKAN